MTMDECIEHVGDAVSYDGRQGVIERIVSLPLVRFDDGQRLQVAPNCLQLVSSATLFN